MDELKDLRDKIDELDEELIKILNKRFHLSLAVGEVKNRTGSPVLALGREVEIRNRLKKESIPEFEEYIRGVYEKIFEESKRLQKNRGGTHG
ncbi:MAG: chorismate mutase [Peptostreptococcaceae bacterium]|nr:chorismate mutase [Peptostreptococcaceae bacterium]